MSLPRFIAQRYLFSRRLPTAVNVLTFISILGIGLGTAALVLVLSVFNGFQSLIKDVFSSFDADIRIVASQGKYMHESDSLYRVLKAQPGIRAVTRTIEGRAILKYHDHQAIVLLKGVEANYPHVTGIKKLIYAGDYRLKNELDEPEAVLGAGVANATSVNLNDAITPMELYTVTDRGNLLTSPEQALQSTLVYPAGVFSVQKEYDDAYTLVDFTTARTLLGAAGRITAYEIKLTDSTADEPMRQRLAGLLGPRYSVRSWFGQHETMYHILRNEKAVGYLVLVLMLLLAACTIVGNLTMIAIEKKQDIWLLRAIGARPQAIHRIFIYEGLLVGSLAAFTGLGLGFTLGALQERFGFLKINGGESFLVDAFPLKLQWSDFLLVFSTVMVLALLSSIYPAFKAGRSLSYELSPIQKRKRGMP